MSYCDFDLNYPDTDFEYIFTYLLTISMCSLEKCSDLLLIFKLDCLGVFCHSVQFSSVQSLSRVWLFATPWITAARPPCPSPSPGVHSDSRTSSWWCHPAISSSVVPFSSCPQSLPASESFPMSWLFTWDGQSTGVSALASFLPKNTQGWSPLEWTGWGHQ